MFGGSLGSMNIVLKNNRYLLKKHRKPLKEIRKLSSYKKSETLAYNYLPVVHSKTIISIGERIKEENRELLYKQLLCFGILMSIAIAAFLYYI